MNHLDAHAETDSKTIFGFWIYLLTDFMMFAALFATYAVLQNSSFGGPTAKELFSLPDALVRTLLLLTASFASGAAFVMAYRKQKEKTLLLFLCTFLFGLAFLFLQFQEGFRLVELGASWKRSAFLSAYFTLVGTHALHLIVALLWTIVLLWPVWRQGITSVSLRRLACLKMFWQFLNIVWILIFTMVYLVGEIGYV